MQGLVVSLTFGTRANLSRPMQKEITADRWEVAAPSAYPFLLVMNHPGEPAAVA